MQQWLRTDNLFLAHSLHFVQWHCVNVCVCFFSQFIGSQSTFWQLSFTVVLIVALKLSESLVIHIMHTFTNRSNTHERLTKSRIHIEVCSVTGSGKHIYSRTLRITPVTWWLLDVPEHNLYTPHIKIKSSSYYPKPVWYRETESIKNSSTISHAWFASRQMPSDTWAIYPNNNMQVYAWFFI